MNPYQAPQTMPTVNLWNRYGRSLGAFFMSVVSIADIYGIHYSDEIVYWLRFPLLLFFVATTLIWWLTALIEWPNKGLGRES